MKKVGLFFVTILLLGSGLLTSCENFLNGAILKTEIENQIAYENATECTLIVKNDSAYGSFLSAGEKKCKVGYTTYLQFTVTTEDYCFMGLEAVSTSDNSVSRGDFVEFTVTNEDEALTTGVYKITVKLLNEANDILIRPKFEKLSNADIKITGTDGEFTPAKGSYNLIVRRSFNISFSPYSDYEFIRWQIYDEKTGDEIPDGKYLLLNEADSKNTYFTFIGVPENADVQLALRPVIAERPQIISNSPQNNGILKDSTIQVLFDREMDEKSIYYTKEEIVSLNESGIPFSDFLPKVDEGELTDTGTLGNHYGHKKEDGKTYFKNISLTNNKTGENLNDKFEAPAFENARTLSIPASKVSGRILDDYTQVLVTIEKGFFYSEPIDGQTTRPVTLHGSKKWMYQITNHGDKDALVFQKRDGKELFVVKLENAETAASLSTASSQPAISNLKFLKIKNKKTSLYCDMELQDVAGGSGPNSTFTIRYQRVKEADYTTAGSAKGSLNFDYTATTSQDAVFKGNLDLDLPIDGVYRIWFDFSDRSNNHFYYPADAEKDNSTKGFYVAKDTGITMATPTVTDSSDKSGIKLKLDWTPPADLKSAKIRYKKNGDSWSSWDTISTNSKEYGSLALNTSYSFQISITDYADYTKVLESSSKTSDLSISVSGTPQKTVYFQGDSFSSSGLTVKASLTNKKAWDLGASEWSNNFSSSVICGTGKTVTVSYSKFDVTRSADINATYYVAASGARPTETPVKLTGYAGTLSGGTYYKFGDFPQTVSAISSYSSTPVYNGWYLGSDGYFYEKCTENASLTGGYNHNYSDRTKVKKSSENSTRYFKVEPIKWRVLTNSYDVDGDSGTATGHLLLAENILTANIPFYLEEKSRTINNFTFGPNFYKYSTIRAYLNGKYENDDNTQGTTYQDKGFLQKAFTATAQNNITSTTLKNSVSRYDTVDKIFLLSDTEVKKTDYGFPAPNEGGGLEGTIVSCVIERTRKPTDFAKANYIKCQLDPSYSSYGEHWWLRTGKTLDKTVLYHVDYYGNVYSSAKVTDLDRGVVPALCVSTLP